jgi:translocation and assembly module TamB
VFESPAVAKLSLEIANVLEHPRWQGRLRTEPVDLTGLNERWPQWRLSGELQAKGDLETATLAAKLTSEHSDWGVLTSALDVHWVPPELRVERVNVTRAGTPASLTATGRVVLGKTPVVSFDLSGDWRHISYPWQGPAEWVTPEGRFDAVGDVDTFVIHVDGMLSAPGSQPDEHAHIAEQVILEAVVEDLRGKPSIKAKAEVPYLRIGEYAANKLRADIDVDATDAGSSHIDVSIAGLQLHEHNITDVQIRGKGRISKHSLEILATRHESRLHIAGSGGWRDPNWTVALDRFDVRNVLSTDWLLSSGEARLMVAQTEVEVQRACWRVFGGSVCVAGQWEKEMGWRSDLDVDALSVSSLGKLWRPELTWTGAVSGRARLSADADNIMTVTAHLGSSEGSATLVTEEKPLVLSYRDIRIDAKIENNQLRGGIRGTIDDHGALRGSIAVDNIFDDTVKRPIEADLHAHFTTLDSLRAVLPDLGIEGGEFDTQLSLGGDLAQPAIRAVARVSNAAVAVPQTGMRLENINIKLESKDDSTIDLVADARSGDGLLHVTGTSQFFDPQNWNLELKIGGADVQAVNLPEAKVIATPDLELKVRPGRIDLGGIVRIDQATISPELAPGARVTLSPDVVIVREDAELSAAVLETYARITIELGDDVNFAGYGLTGKLRGSLNIVQEPSRATLATGDITISDGVYSIYGRKLDISTGRLIFAGGAIDNPGIDARAMRKIDDVTVTASLRGTLRQPEFSLTSEPVMSDTDMLSYLVLGRPANQIGGGDATLLLDAASTLLPKGGSIGVTDRIKSVFGLETLAIETRKDAEQETRETSLVLGRYLTPRLFIAYAAGVANTLNVFRVRYELSKRWLLQTESSSQESGGDVLFKIEH